MERSTWLFCCEVYNHIRMLLLEELVDCFAVSDAFFYKTEIWIVHDRSQGREIAGIGQAVQTDDPVIRVFFQHVENEVASDKSGTAGNDNIHSGKSFLVCKIGYGWLKVYFREPYKVKSERR